MWKYIQCKKAAQAKGGGNGGEESLLFLQLFFKKYEMFQV